MATTYTYYTRWHLCYYYDLELYYEQIRKLETCVTQLREICEIMLDRNICNITTAMFASDLSNIQTNNDAMRLMHKRQKRAPLEFIGKLSNLMFGIMDAETARNYDEKINEMQKEVEVSHEMAKRKTTLIKGVIELNNVTLNDFRDNIVKMETQVHRFQKSLNQRVDEIMIDHKLRDISSVATLIMMDHNELSNQIRTALEESMDGGI